MSSALKPALPPTGGQSPGNPAPGKPQNLPQHTGASNPYSSASLGHVPPNLAGLPHAHSNMGIPTQNIAANMSTNQVVPNIPQMGHSGMNQTPAHNMQSPIKASTVPPSATAASAMPAHTRPNIHSYVGATNAPPSAAHPRDDEGTTLPPSQNSAQLMAMHRAQQQIQHHIEHQPPTMERLKQQQQSQQPQIHQSNQQQPQQTQQVSQVQQPQPNQQVSQQQHQQSNGMATSEQPVAAKTTNAIPTVPTPVVKPSETTVTTSTPPVQNHVSPVASTPSVNDTKASTESATSATVGNATQVQTQVTSTNVDQPKQASPTIAAIATTNETVSESAAPTAAVVTPTKPVITVAVLPKETAPKPHSTMKLATTPRNITRKRENKSTKNSESPKSTTTNSPTKTPDGKSPGAQNNKPPDKTTKTPRTSSEEGRSKRSRTRTQPYQSPLPELALISKLSSTSSSPMKNQDEKLIVFYKNEFLAVRNAEGGFYVCQAVQNVYKSSMRIRIRWLSQGQDKIYIPDFYDTTEFDCILTNLNMERVEKGKYNLPKDELERTENILNRAIAVESGESAPSLTEEHPDGLDLSLFRDESQLKKNQSPRKRKSKESSSGGGSPSKKSKKTKKTPDKSKSRKASRSPAKLVKKNHQQTDKKLASNSSSKDSANRKSDGGRAERAKRRGGGEVITPASSTKTSPVVDQRKARVLAVVAKNVKLASTLPIRNNKKKGAKPSTSGSSKLSVTPAASTSKSGAKSTRSQGSAPSVPVPTASTSSTRRKKGKK